MRDELKEKFRHANLVLAVAAPPYLVASLLLRHAGEGVLLGLAVVFFFGGLAAGLVLNERAERRRQRDQ